MLWLVYYEYICMILNIMFFFFLKVEDIELKLDLFIDLYKEDRKLLL